MTKHVTLESLILRAAQAIRPPERLTVSEAAHKYRELDNPGSYKGKWLNEKTPYLVEPMNVLTSMDYTGMVFVGPAQCGKTDMLLNWIAYSAKCDPADMMVVQMSQSTARDFSKRRMDKLFRQSPKIGELRRPGRQNQNVFDTSFTSGMYLTTSWPTINELSGKPIPRLWLTDYDRMDDDIDGDGSPFDLCRTRAKSFKRFGMCAAESSPGRVQKDGNWRPSTPHEAPPTGGILSLYNRGDRRRFYWCCPQCRFKFEPSFSRMQVPNTLDKMEAAEAACMACDCGYPITEEKRYDVNLEGRWIKDGMRWEVDGSISGQPIRSDIASFWLKGPAAALGEWRQMVLNLLSATETYEKDGNDEALKTTINVDQGEAYIVPQTGEDRLPENLKDNTKDYPLGSVPQWVRFLLATIDVQKNMFVVQVHGIGKGRDVCIVDRFSIKTSNRIDISSDKDAQFLWVNPGSYPEDWDLLIAGVLTKTYPIHGDDQGRRMQIKRTACDSGGREGVTRNAYEFYRRLKKDPDEKWGDLWKRFQLVKGDPFPTAPRVRISYPDSERKDRRAAARGEVPVLFINTNLMKDEAEKMLGRRVGDHGGGSLSFPTGLPDSFFVEMTTEVRDKKGKWTNPKDRRNESWDLLVYCLSLCLDRQVAIERIDWDNPPGWACEYAKNDLVFAPAEAPQGRFVTAPAKPKHDLAALGGRML